MNNQSPFAANLTSQIEKEYQLGEYDLGWRLLSCPSANIQASKICFIGLNPAGKTPDIENDGFSSEFGSSYEIERWGKYSPGEAPLQKQVCALFDFISVSPNQVLSGNLVPFRSPRFTDLPYRNRAIRFGEGIWKQILDTSKIELIISMGNEVTHSIGKTLKIGQLNKHPSGWGNISIYLGENSNVRLVGLPHLSTFKLFSRPNCKEHLEAVFQIE